MKPKEGVVGFLSLALGLGRTVAGCPRLHDYVSHLAIEL